MNIIGQKSQLQEVKTPSNEKILVADDASFMRLMIKQVLSRYGQTNVIEAENGEVAVSKFIAECPDLTLMDITMPVVDGLTALEKILSVDSDAKVVMCSAVAQDSMVKEALNRGASGFVVKPFRPEELMEAVQQYI